MGKPKEAVWILDDEEEISEIIAWELSDSFRTKLFNHPDQLIEALRAASRPPELIISDISMPGMNGIELCRTLLDDFETKVPVVLISGFAEKEHALEAMELGVYRIIEKPFDKGQITTAINEVMKISRLEKLNRKLVTTYRQSIDRLSELVKSYKQQCAKAEQKLIASATTDDNRAFFTDYLAELPDHNQLEQLCESAKGQIREMEKTIEDSRKNPSRQKKNAA